MAYAKNLISTSEDFAFWESGFDGVANYELSALTYIIYKCKKSDAESALDEIFSSSRWGEPKLYVLWAYKILGLNEKFEKAKQEILKNHPYAVSSEGCMRMEEDVKKLLPTKTRITYYEAHLREEALSLFEEWYGDYKRDRANPDAYCEGLTDDQYDMMFSSLAEAKCFTLNPRGKSSKPFGYFAYIAIRRNDGMAIFEKLFAEAKTGEGRLYALWGLHLLGESARSASLSRGLAGYANMQNDDGEIRKVPIEKILPGTSEIKAPSMLYLRQKSALHYLREMELLEAAKIKSAKEDVMNAETFSIDRDGNITDFDSALLGMNHLSRKVGVGLAAHIFRRVFEKSKNNEGKMYALWGLYGLDPEMCKLLEGQMEGEIRGHDGPQNFKGLLPGEEKFGRFKSQMEKRGRPASVQNPDGPANSSD